MKETLIDAQEELKRAEHMIYVSLKYTRTGDVIKNIIQRLIASMNFVVTALLKKAEEQHKIFEIPDSPAEKCALVRKIYSEDIILMNYIEFYLLLRKLSRAEFKSKKEFRRHVNISALVDGEEIEIDIDIISEYFHITGDFVKYVHKKSII